jgi:hypothetical protein
MGEWVSNRVPSKSEMTTFILGPILSASALFAVQKVKICYTRQHVREWVRKRRLNAEEAFLYIFLQVHSYGTAAIPTLNVKEHSSDLGASWPNASRRSEPSSIVEAGHVIEKYHS